MKVEEDMEFLVAAEEDDMVARTLICLSRSETCLPWVHHQGPLKQRPTPPTEGVARLLLPPETRWGVRRTRTRSVATEGTKKEEEEEAFMAAAVAGRRASPTTPLSWSGWSWSVCRAARPATPGPPKRRPEPSSHEHEESRPAAPAQDAELRCGGERIRPPARRLSLESHGDSPLRVSASAAAPAAAVAFFSGYAPQEKPANGAAAGRTETSSTAAQVEPLGQRWTGSGSASGRCRRSAKKKTVAELHALEESLSMEQEKLRKELQKHKGIYQELLEENMRLKKVESRVAPHMLAKKQTATYVTSEAAADHEWPQHVESTSESQTVDEPSMVSFMPGEGRREQLQWACSPVSVPGRMLRFDLNCLPDEYV